MVERSARDPEIFSSLVENSPDLFYRTDLEGKIIYISPSVARLSGYTAQEAHGMDMAQEVYLYPEERQSFLEKLKKDGFVKDFEARLKRRDGSVWWASTTARFFTDKDGNIQGVEGMTRDITELKETYQALLDSEERFRQAFQTSPDGISLNRLSDGMFIDINEGFTVLSGYTRDDVIGKTPFDIRIWKDLTDRGRLIEGLKTQGSVKNLEALFMTKAGEIRSGLMSARVLTIQGEEVFLSVTRDITELKRSQEMVVQSEKMVSIGGLAAGMAHEINNPLAGMIQSAEVMIKRLTDIHMPANQEAALTSGFAMEDLQQFLERRDILKMATAIRESGRRMADIVDNMLSFARKKDNGVSTYDLADLLDKTLELAGTDFDLKKHYDFRNIAVEKHYEPGVPPVACEGAKIQQVFLNILKNAAEAMQESSTDQPLLTLAVNYQPESRMVRVKVGDNGPGMDPSIQKRVFEPFFTTKPVGVGTGLGMSISYFIIAENHGGIIDVESVPGKGATFSICLPLGRKRSSI